MFNVVLLSGRFVRDPELDYVELDDKKVDVCDFTICTDGRSYKNAEGKRQCKPVYVDCTAWDSAAKFIVDNFKKGYGIEIKGELEFNSWADKEGKKHSKLSVRCSQFGFPVPGKPKPRNEDSVGNE